MTRAELARVMCCPSGVCSTPHACRVDDTTRAHLVDIHTAAAAVEQHTARAIHEACAATIQQARNAWRARGPMSRAMTLGTGEME